MARLEFPIAPDGLICDALVGVPGTIATAMIAGGHLPPAPVQCRAQIDTGCSCTSLNPTLLRRIGLGLPVRQASSQTASGNVGVNLLRIGLSLFDSRLSPSPMLSESDLLVVELSAVLADVDVLIGMDIIRTCRLLVDGPAGVFALDW